MARRSLPLRPVLVALACLVVAAAVAAQTPPLRYPTIPIPDLDPVDYGVSDQQGLLVELVCENGLWVYHFYPRMVRRGDGRVFKHWARTETRTTGIRCTERPVFSKTAVIVDTRPTGDVLVYHAHWVCLKNRWAYVVDEYHGTSLDGELRVFRRVERTTDDPCEEVNGVPRPVTQTGGGTGLIRDPSQPIQVPGGGLRRPGTVPVEPAPQQQRVESGGQQQQQQQQEVPPSTGGTRTRGPSDDIIVRAEAIGLVLDDFLPETTLLPSPPILRAPGDPDTQDMMVLIGPTTLPPGGMPGQAAPPGPDAAGAVRAYVRSLGVSTGEAFEVSLVNVTAEAIDLADGAVVVQPLAMKVPAEVAKDVAALPAGLASAAADGYCLEFLQRPPVEGQLFRVAPPEVQAKYEPMRRVLRASQTLQDAGRLNPDSDPAQYFHAIRQWSIWTREQGFTEASYASAFVDHTRKNLAAAGRPWSAQVEGVLRKLVPGRWRDIQAVLREADAGGAR